MPRGATPSKHDPKRNDGVDWEAAKLDYVTSHVPHTTIAEKYGVKVTALRRRAKDAGWDEARTKYQEDFHEQTTQSKIENAAARLTQWNEETLLHAGLLREAARRQFQYQTEAGWRFKDNTSAKDISAAASAHVAADKLARLALGASTDNVNNVNKSLPASVDDFF